jgi:hypothetical protein
LRELSVPAIASAERSDTIRGMFTHHTLARGSRSVFVLMLAAASFCPQPASAQPAASPPTAADFARLQAELAILRSEVASLRAALGELTTPGGPSAPLADPQIGAPGSQPPAQVTPEMLELLKSQVGEQAQSKVESASRMPVKLTGTILTNTYVNSGEGNWPENPNLVGNPSTESGARGSMSATARQSRLGLDVAGIAVGSWQASGTIIADFLGGVPGFQTGTVMGLPRLIYAFGRVESDRTAIEIGQDHAILAPRDPTSLAAFSFPLLFRSGNLYLRVPQARVERKLRDELTVTMGIVAPVAGDTASTYEFAPPPGAGERSMRPAFEGRVGFARGSSDTPREIAVGASGHYGWRRSATARSEGWAVALDFNGRAGRVGAAGEYFAADNAEPFGGGISQSGRASGGWAEGRFSLTKQATLTGGFGRDKPADALGRVLRQDNRTIFASTIVQLTPELGASLEYRWMETQVGTVVPVKRENHHVNAVFAVKF